MKATKSVPAKKATKKPAKKADKSLHEILLDLDKGFPDPRSIHTIANDLDDICSRLAEIEELLAVAADDCFDSSSSRTTTLLCLAERLLRGTSETCGELSGELFRANRAMMKEKK